MQKSVAVITGLLLASGLAMGEEKADKATFKALDKNQDGVLTQEELADKQDLLAHFAAADMNRDGRLSPDEFGMLREEAEEAE